MEPTMESLVAEVASLRSDIKNLTKLVRQVKSIQDDPTGEKRKTRAANNGFNRKMEITPELRTFLNLSETDKISRSEVTRKINVYINDKGLKHPDNGRHIIMDENLKSLLSPPDGIQVTFLNIQKYLSPHYLKVADLESSTDAEISVATDTTPEVSSEPKKVAKRPTVRKAKA